MKIGRLRGSIGIVIVSILMTITPDIAAQAMYHQHSAALDTALIVQAVGTSGTWNAGEGVYKLSFPRTDVQVKVDGIPMPPFMGLATWVGFQQGGESTMVMGDMVLFQDEVNPVMSVLLDGGMTVTGLHNHFFFSEPMVFFMHVGGDGNLDVLVRTVRAALDKVKAIRAEHPTPVVGFGSPANMGASAITALPIEQTLGIKGSANNGMLKFMVGRTVKMPCGCTAGKEMGVTTWAAFMGSDARAVMDGDFATAEGELQPVLRSLRHSGINVVAIHNHMEGETPRLIFLHYWGVGPAVQLAHDFRSALDAQAAATIAAK